MNSKPKTARFAVVKKNLNLDVRFRGGEGSRKNLAQCDQKIPASLACALGGKSTGPLEATGASAH